MAVSNRDAYYVIPSTYEIMDIIKIVGMNSRGLYESKIFEGSAILVSCC